EHAMPLGRARGTRGGHDAPVAWRSLRGGVTAPTAEPPSRTRMTEPTTAPPPARPRWILPLLGTGIVGLVAATNIGNAVWARWIESNPLGLLALNSTNKYLLGTSIVTDFWPYLGVASA